MRPTRMVERWLDGFCLSRGLAPRSVGGVVEVHVDGGGRRLELVMVEPDAALFRATVGRLLLADDVWLTVFHAGPHLLTPPDGVRVVRDDETLMTRPLSRSDPAREVDVVVTDAVATATVREGGVTAARGSVALVEHDAIFDRIETHAEFRRRGLGTAVMAALTGWALDGGGETGLLAASTDGRALYERLGWQVAAGMLTLAREPAP